MNHPKPFLFLAFGRWGNLRPALCEDPEGRCFIPLCLGIWMRQPHWINKYEAAKRDNADLRAENERLKDSVQALMDAALRISRS
jgi:hypothetical protein